METFSLLLIAMLSGAALIALFLCLDIFFPQRIARTLQVAETSQGRSFLLGLVNFLFFGAIAVALIALGENYGIRFIAIPAVVIAIILAAGLTLGLAAVAQLVGGRLFPERTHLQRNAWGGGVLILACLTPYVGWFGLFPFAALLGLGALIGGWRHSTKQDQLETES